jgi:NTP pyrophosphatase (non-canonical NTP hydrolase)
MRQVQQDIHTWHLATFPDATVEDVTIKLMEEAGEIARAVHERRYPRVKRNGTALDRELCDTLICVAEIASRAGIDLQAAFDAHWPDIQDRDRHN